MYEWIRFLLFKGVGPTVTGEQTRALKGNASTVYQTLGHLEHRIYLMKYDFHVLGVSGLPLQERVKDGPGGRTTEIITGERYTYVHTSTKCIAGTHASPATHLE